MPLFVFVSGLFAKTIMKNGRFRIERVLSFVALAFLFQVVLILIEKPDRLLTDSLLNFGSAPWYLLSMAYWYVSVLFLSQIKAKWALPLSILVALAAGCFKGFDDFMALSRTLVFFPFFVAGYYLTREQVTRIRGSRWLPCTAVLVLAFCILWFLFDGWGLVEFAYISHGATPYESSRAMGVLLRCLFFVLAIFISLGVLFITPKRACLLTKLGERTLQIYVLHRIIRGVCSELGLFDLSLFQDQVLCIAVVLLISAVVTAICSLKPLKRPFDALAGSTWKFLRVR